MNGLDPSGPEMSHPAGTVAEVNRRLIEEPEPLMPARPDPGSIPLVGGGRVFTGERDFVYDPVSGLAIG